MGYGKRNKLHIVAVTAVIRDAEGRYLLLKRSEREIAYPGKYAFPGGKVEDNDSPAEALDKEVWEEAGLRLKPEKILLDYGSFVRPDGQSVKVFQFFCQAEDTSRVKISDDFTDFVWLKPSELHTVDHLGYTEQLDHAEAVYQAKADPAFYAKSWRTD